MIGGVLALAVLAMGAAPSPTAAEQNPELDVDPCVEVDEAAVQDLIDLQLRDGRAGHAPVPITVVVRCLEGAQEIRVEPWASLGQDGTRPIQLPAREDGGPAAQEARSRELALAITELIRILEITHPLPQAPAAPVVAPAPVVAAAVVSPAAPTLAADRWEIGVTSAFEYFGRGQRLTGGDLSIGASFARWILTEVRAGGRAADDETLPWLRLTARVGTAAVGTGVHWWSERRALGVALLVRAQGYLVGYRGEDPAGGRAARNALYGALIFAAEPRLMLGLTRHVALTLGGAAGLPVHGIVVRAQGTETASIAGLFLSGNLGAVLTF